MTDITLADASEYQPNVDADAYIKGGHAVLIVRVHNGYRPDKEMPGRARYLRGKPFVALGWYQFLAEDRDAATQAREFISTVGALHPNEFPILDLEKGRGNQTPRAEAWFKVIDQWAGFQASLYSGSSFIRYQLNTTAHWGSRPLWIASYPNSYQPVPSLEPGGADWWQYTDRGHFPGIPGAVDGSIFHGTAQQFLARVRPGRSSHTNADTPGGNDGTSSRNDERRTLRGVRRGREDRRGLPRVAGEGGRLGRIQAGPERRLVFARDARQEQVSSNGQLPPSELAPIAQGQLVKTAAASWNAMNVEARRLGCELLPTGSMSSYRTLEQQRILYARYRAGTGNLAAVPGTSNHGWGLAVDVASHEMRAMVDRVGEKYGWAKKWSDAPSEWWHIRFQPGYWHGPDPGPYGQHVAPPPPPKNTADIVVVAMPDGRLEAFVEIETVGAVLHAWQDQNRIWTSWHSLGMPGN